MKIIKLTALLLVTGFLSYTAQAETSGETIKNWRKNCLSCHGKDGVGSTKAGRKAKAKDLTDATYQASFTDEEAFKSLKEGMKDGDRVQMKPFADKLSDEEIKALVAYSRTFKK